MQQRARVLIVDDTPANIHILMEALKDTYAITAATNGQKALDITRSEAKPDIILLDIMMPEIDGYEVCRQLKLDVRTDSIPVIFITALTDEEDEARGLDLGAVDFITKPFRPGIVKSRVRNHLELKRHRDHLQDLVEEQVEEIADSHIATIFAMSKLAESRDDDTGKHLERTQIYCRMLAEQLGTRDEMKSIIDAEYIETIFHASPLHDIGKVAVPDAVLCKPGKLTDEEFAIMRTHTRRGAETLFIVAKRFPNNEFLNMGLDIARWHHEKWAGGGYPDGISGEEIPLCARIMAVSDVYDALTSKRCYKEPMPHSRAAEILRNDAGTHFDPLIIEAFNAIEAEFDRVRSELGN
jgi:putative two-component system response regulator